MRFHILTIFPDFFSTPLKYGVIGRAVSKGLLEVTTHDLREFTADRHRSTDDYPYGGGCGMVMKVEPVVKALESLEAGLVRNKMVILATPQGRPLNQALARELSTLEDIVIICGRYEGFDERIRRFADMEVSIGDYVLTGGEAASLVLMDAVGRLVPGVLGDSASGEEDSFSDGLLEYPQYTRPAEFRGLKVPEVLLSGNHSEIEAFRRAERVKRTADRRPELLKKASPTGRDGSV